MKQLSLIINVVLLALVGYLYYLHFSSPKHAVTLTHFGKDSFINHGNKVAYIDVDSLQNNYGYYKKIKEDLDQKQTASANEINNLQKKFQARAMQLQQKGPAMSQVDQESAMKEINQMQQDLQTKKQTLDNELFNYNSKMKEDILSRIQNYLKKYNKDGRYDYILSYEPGFMFYKDTTLNITRDVVEGLNKEYIQDKK
ncbi:MAG: OmpH family outer membrane protein [Ginsengibacter sp.]